jgi:glycosyltransferase involved in cell wall biosynthesis
MVVSSVIPQTIDWFRRRMARAEQAATRALRNYEQFTNREGHKEFDFILHKGRLLRGISFLIRARNEESKIEHCMRSVLDFAQEVVFIDNGSEDRTHDIVKALSERAGEDRKIRILRYPFKLARFGPEHDRTAEDSVHSAVYYSNWGISHCSYRYICKWDGDMVLARDVRAAFKALLNRLQEESDHCWTFPGQTIYRDAHGDYYHSVGEVNQEIMIFPYGYQSRFHKVRHWECLQSTPPLPVKHFSPVTFYELKYCDEDEFDHWSTNSWPSDRKRREWANFHMIKTGAATGTQFRRLPAGFIADQVDLRNVPASD